MKKLNLMLLVGIGALFLLTGCQDANTESTEPEVTQEKIEMEDFVYQKYKVDVEDKVKLGEVKAETTILLVFDYSCSWCKKWMEEVLPVIKEQYIETGKAKYVGQPIVLLNETSLFMAHMDYSLEKEFSDKYYDFQLQFAKDAELENWGTEEYIQKTLKEKGLHVDVEELKGSDYPDPITVTRNYTKNYGVEFVPTLYINGIKLYDAFNMEEIDSVLTGKIKENDVIQVPKAN